MTREHERAKEIMDALNAIYKEPVVSLGSDQKHVVKYLPTGLLPFDILLPGGLPRGRMIEIFGGPSSLKSYFALCGVAQTQRDGGMCALLDTEHTFDAEWAKEIGVDLDALIVPEVPTGERAFDIAQTLVMNGVDLIVFDSVAAAQPQTYNENPLEDNKIQPGRHAALFSLGLRKVTAVNKNTCVLYTNQTRTSIGVTFGNPETTPGGNALPFYASLRLRMQHSGKITVPIKTWDGEKWVDGKRQVAQRFRAEAVKSKLSSPYGQVSFVFDLTTGCIDMPSFIVAQGLELGLIGRVGNAWIFDDTRITGREKFLNAVADDLQLQEAITDKIREHYGLVVKPAAKRRHLRRVK